VDGDLFPDVQLVHDAAQGALDAVLGHGVRGSGSLLLVLPEGGEEPEGVAVRGPVGAQHLEGAGWEGDVAVLGALAAVDVHEHARAVDVAELEMEGLGEAQSQGVDGPEEGLVVRRAGGVDDAVDLVAAQHVGQGLGAGDPELSQGGPVVRGDAGVEEADAVEGEAQRGGGPVCS
jgi:hypothetical protein